MHVVIPFSGVDVHLDLRLRMRCDGVDLVCRLARIDQDECGTQFTHGEHEAHQRRAVLACQQHPVARFHTQAGQGGPGSHDARAKL